MDTSRRTISVVVVDDEPGSRALLEATLETRTAFRVVGTAEDGIEAVAAAAREQPDVVLLDVAMPRMDGLEALPRIREVAPDTKVVVLSAYSQERMAAEALRVGAAAYVEKSVGPTPLLEQLASLFPDVPIGERPAARPHPTPAARSVAGTPAERRDGLLLDSLEEGVLVLAPDATIGQANVAARRLLGIGTRELVGRNLTSVGLEEAAVSALLEDARVAGRPRSHVHIPLRRPEGEQRDLLVSARPIVDPASVDVRETLVSLVDVTDVYDAQRRLHDHAERSRVEAALLERLFDNLHLLIAHLDADFNFIRVNSAYAAADGHVPQYFVGKNHFDLYPDPENEEIFRRVVQSGAAYSVFAKPFVYPDHPARGATHWDWTVRPLTDAQGRVNELVLTLVDRTAEVSARTRFDQLVAGVEAIAMPVFLMASVRDDTGAVTDFVYRYVNHAGLSLLQRQAEEVVGHRLLELFPSHLELGIFDKYRHVVESRTSLHTEIEGFDEHGVRGTFEITVSPVGDGYVLFGHDITARKQAQADLAASRRELQEALQEVRRSNAYLEGFASIAAHDLRGPLTTISGMLELLQRQYVDDLEDQARLLVSRAVHNARRLATQLDSLLELARVQATNVDLEPLDPRTVLDEALESLGAQIEDGSGTVTVGDLPPVVADHHGLHQVFQNLIQNALKFHRPGVPPAVEVRGWRDDDRTWIEVADRGPGFGDVPPDELFELYRRQPQATDRGAGLGLAICRRIIERNGGQIVAADRDGGGARVRFSLPSGQRKASAGQ